MQIKLRQDLFLENKMAILVDSIAHSSKQIYSDNDSIKMLQSQQTSYFQGVDFEIEAPAPQETAKRSDNPRENASVYEAKENDCDKSNP